MRSLQVTAGLCRSSCSARFHPSHLSRHLSTPATPPPFPTRPSPRVSPDHRSASLAFAQWLLRHGLKGHSQLTAPSSSSSSDPSNPRALGFGIKQGPQDWKLIATESIRAGEPILTLPLDLTLAVDPPTPSPSSPIPPLTFPSLAPLLPHIPTTLWQLSLGLRLLSERTSPTPSFFHPYISLLPLAFPTVPLFFTHSDLVALQYPPLLTQITLRSKLLLSLPPLIASLQSRSPHADPFHATRIDANALGWAMTAVSSRAFALHDQRRLLPLIDFCNHSFSPSTHLALTDPHTLTLSAVRDLQAGDELTLTYGQHGNDHLLLNYGIVDDSNPYDDLLVRWDPSTLQLALDLTAPSNPSSPSSAFLLHPFQSALLSLFPTSDLHITRDALDPRIHALLLLLLTPPTHPIVPSLTSFSHPYLSLTYPHHDPHTIDRTRRAEGVWLGLIAGAWGGPAASRGEGGRGGGLDADLKELVRAAEEGREERVVALRYRIAKKRLLREHINRLERLMNAR